MYITRKSAIETLNRLIISDILSDKLEEDLQQILNCISAEEDGLFLWGAGDDADDLFVAMREELVTVDWAARCNEIFEKYKIK